MITKQYEWGTLKNGITAGEILSDLQKECGSLEIRLNSCLSPHGEIANNESILHHYLAKDPAALQRPEFVHGIYVLAIPDHVCRSHVYEVLFMFS